MSQADLKGKWALILGASSGFGAATARELAKNGVNIIGLHLDRGAALEGAKALAAELAAEYSVKTHFINMNIASAEKRADAIAKAKEMLGEQKIHMLMHSVAFGSLLPFVTEDMSNTLTQPQVEMTLDVMANSLVYWTQDLWRAKLLGRGSRIFSMTSSGSVQMLESYGAVSAAKCTLESHTRQLALELAPHGVLVNCIMAGVTNTAAMRKIPGSDKILELASERNPAKRLTTPHDIAVTIRALCDPEIQWISGQVIVVDGGELITGR